MSDSPDQPDAQADLGEQETAPAAASGTDVAAEDLDVEKGADGDPPASSDPDAYVGDATLGGTGGKSSGGAG